MDKNGFRWNKLSKKVNYCSFAQKQTFSGGHLLQLMPHYQLARAEVIPPGIEGHSDEWVNTVENTKIAYIL